MQKPIQITFRQLEASAALEARIRQEAAKLEKFSDDIVSCNVVVESPHRHHQSVRRYQLTVVLKVPETELVVKQPSDNPAYEDAYVAVRDAFNALTRQLEDYSRKRQGKVKAHSLPYPKSAEAS